MHHNLKIEMERVNNQYVTQIELSTFGRCGRARLVSDSFDAAMELLQAKHDELLASAQAFHQGAQPPATNITHPSEATAGQKEPAPAKHTREQLEAVAESEGIKGLRRLAAPLGVKGTAIDGLIEGILTAQDQEAESPADEVQAPQAGPAAPLQAKEAPRQFAAQP